jgi:hypothetical protein
VVGVGAPDAGAAEGERFAPFGFVTLDVAFAFAFGLAFTAVFTTAFFAAALGFAAFAFATLGFAVFAFAVFVAGFFATGFFSAPRAEDLATPERALELVRVFGFAFARVLVLPRVVLAFALGFVLPLAFTALAAAFAGFAFAGLAFAGFALAGFALAFAAGFALAFVAVFVAFLGFEAFFAAGAAAALDVPGVSSPVVRTESLKRSQNDLLAFAIAASP